MVYSDFPNLQKTDYEVDRNTETIKSPVLDGFLWLSHGVTTRDFAPADMEVSDLMADVRRRLVPGGERIFCGDQVHGNSVAMVKDSGQADGADIRGPVVQFNGVDGLITSTPSLPIAIRTADCVPVILVDVLAKRIAVVHAGWRGTMDRIAEKAVGAMVEQGSDAENIVAWIGPAISRAAYEVSPDLADRFRDAFPDQDGILIDNHLDLVLLNAFQLREAGVAAPQIHAANCCTFKTPKTCCSHRREGKNAGRMVTYAMILE